MKLCMQDNCSRFLLHVLLALFIGKQMLLPTHVHVSSSTLWSPCKICPYKPLALAATTITITCLGMLLKTCLLMQSHPGTSS